MILNGSGDIVAASNPPFIVANSLISSVNGNVEDLQQPPSPCEFGTPALCKTTSSHDLWFPLLHQI